MDLDGIKEIATTGGALLLPIGIVLHSLYTWRKTGEIDLRKTLEACKDVFVLVVEMVEKGKMDPSKAVDAGVKEVEALRGKTLNKTLKRKAAARLERMLKEKVDLSVNAE